MLRDKCVSGIAAQKQSGKKKKYFEGRHTATSSKVNIDFAKVGEKI